MTSEIQSKSAADVLAAMQAASERKVQCSCSRKFTNDLVLVCPSCSREHLVLDDVPRLLRALHRVVALCELQAGRKTPPSSDGFSQGQINEARSILAAIQEELSN